MARDPAPPGEDLFAVLGVPRRFAQDAAELERRFRERARASHPDRFTRAAPRDRLLALERTARLNQAYRALLPPRSRAAHLLQLLDGPSAAPATVDDPALLERTFALRERIAAARAAQDGAELERLAGTVAARLASLDERLGALLAPEVPPAEARRAAARALAEARLLERALEAARGELP